MATITKAANRHTVVATGWTSPSNAYATTGDNNYATLVSAKNSTRSGDFGFPDFTSSDIPDGATINSVTVTVEWGMTAAVTGGTLGLQPRVNNADSGSETTKTTTTEAQSSATFGTVTLSDLRNAETSDLIEARIRVTKGSTNSAMTGNLDFVSITVDYTVVSEMTVVAYRFRNDDGNETTATWKAGENTNIALGTNIQFRLRVEINKTAGSTTDEGVFFQARKNGGSWDYIDDTSRGHGVKMGDSASFAGQISGWATTDQLTSGTGTFQTGEYNEDPVSTDVNCASMVAGRHTEHEMPFILETSLAGGDVIEFQMVPVNGTLQTVTNSVTPQITVTLFMAHRSPMIALLAQ